MERREVFFNAFQIQSLLNDKRVSEALDLARNARKTGLSKENFTKVRNFHRLIAIVLTSSRQCNCNYRK